MSALIALLRARFEIGRHPLVPLSLEPCPGKSPGVSRVWFRTRTGERVRGWFWVPEGHGRPLPAVLVLHAHGNRYGIGADELLHGRPALAAPLGPALAAIGVASLCLDLPCFGARAATTEAAAAKAALWDGRSLAGQMLGESHAALGWLSDCAEIDAARLGLFGLSMGATLGYWLAAVEPRLKAVAQLCCLADFAPLIATGAHDLHGPYLTVPGLLTLATNGTIAGLIAPRAQFVGLGDGDPLTPPAAADPALAALGAAYRQRGGELRVHRSPDTGHVETPAMRDDVLRFFAETLR